MLLSLNTWWQHFSPIAYHKWPSSFKWPRGSCIWMTIYSKIQMLMCVYRAQSIPITLTWLQDKSFLLHPILWHSFAHPRHCLVSDSIPKASFFSTLLNHALLVHNISFALPLRHFLAFSTSFTKFIAIMSFASGMSLQGKGLK